MNFIKLSAIAWSFFILLLVSFSQDVVAEEPAMDIQIMPSEQIVFPGEDFFYNMQISNIGDGAAHNVSISVDMSGQGSILPNPNLDCFSDGPTLIYCDVPDTIEPGESLDTFLAVQVDSDASFDAAFSSSFEVYYESVDQSPNGILFAIDSTPTLPQSNQALLSVTMGEGNGEPPIAGQSFSLWVSVYNKGPADAELVSVWYEISGPGVFSEEDLPAECFAEMTTGIICDIPLLLPDSYFDNEITILVDQDAVEGQSFANVVELWSETEDPITEDNISEWDYPQVMAPEILPLEFDLSVDLQVSNDVVLPGETFSYTITVTNNGPDDTDYVRVVDEFDGPGNIVESSIPPQCDQDEWGDIFCEMLEGIQALESYKFTFDVKVDQDPQTDLSFYNAAWINQAETGEEFNFNNNTDSLEDIPQVEIELEPIVAELVIGTTLESTVLKLPLVPGQKFSQTITVSNYGPVDSELVNVVNAISGPGNISESDMPQKCFVNPSIANQIVCSLGTIETQKSKNVTLYWLIDSDAQSGQFFENEYSVTSMEALNDNQTDSFSLEIILPEAIEEIDPAEELQNRINEQQREKSLQELEELVSQKLAILNEKQTAYQYYLSTSNNPSEIIDAQKQYMDAKINYVQTLQEYLDKKPQPTNTELQELATLVAELEMEYEEFAYSQIFNEISPPIENPVIEDFDAVEQPTPAPENQDPQLYLLEQAYNTSPEAAEEYAESQGLTYQNGKTRVLIEVTDEEQIQKLKEIANLETFDGNFVQVEIAISDLQKIKDTEFVKNYRPPTIALQNAIGNVISEGVHVINADLVQKGGFTGKGIKMAVLDLGFDKNNQEISNNIKDTKSFRYDKDKSLMDLRGPDDHQHVHGTGVAEIIVDVAPDVGLYLYSMGTEMEFVNAVDYAMSKKIDVIAMSAGWLNYPTDGSSPMTKKIEEAINSGIVFVVSSGNYAHTHWEGKYQDNDNNNWHEFSGNDEGLTFKVKDSQKGRPIVVFLLWYGTSALSEDYDLILTNSDGRDVSSESNPSRSTNEILLESVNFAPKVAGEYSLGITYVGEGTPKATLEVFSPFNALEYTSPSGSVGVPTDARGLIVTGAVHYESLSLEYYSSQGPTNNGIKVPTIVAPDAVNTLAKPNFQGTSAAAPHVAGVVALLLEKEPSSTPSEIKKLLETNADKDSVALSVNYDTLFGYGKVDSGFMIGSAKPSMPDWIKNNAGWWAAGDIDDSSFLQGIQFLIKERIMVIPPTQSGEAKSDEVPSWVKNNAGWWAAGDIDDSSFLQGIQFLIKEGIITA